MNVYVSQMIGETTHEFSVALDGDGGIAAVELLTPQLEAAPLPPELGGQIDWRQLQADALEAAQARERGWR